MDRIIAVISLALTLLISTNVTAKTILVYPGNGTLQAAIDNASGGDVLLLRKGNYLSSAKRINVNKSVTLRPENVVERPNITVPLYIGGECSTSILIQQLIITSGITSDGMACANQVAIVQNEFIDSYVSFSKHIFKKLFIIGNDLEESYIVSNGYSYTRDGYTGIELVYIAANNISGGYITNTDWGGWIPKATFVVGNKIIPSIVESNEFQFGISNKGINNYTIGNYVELGISRNSSNYVYGIFTHGTNDISTYTKVAANNVVKLVPLGNSSGDWSVEREIVGIVNNHSNNSFLFVQNNLITFADDMPELAEGSGGIYLGHTGAAYNNIIVNFPGEAVYDQSNELYEVNYNLCYQNGTNCGDDRDNLNIAPLYNETDYTPLSGSPLIDGGFELVQYNDLDGTRNDIGVHGGPYGYAQYQAQLEDSDKPYVFPIFGVTQPDEPNSVAVSVLAVARMK